MSDTKTSLLSLEIREVFQNQHDKLAMSKDFKVVMSHFGSFSQDLVSKLSLASEEILTSAGDKKKVVKRVFSILIEGLQNIRIHGSEDEFDKQLGYLIFASNKKQYRIIMANVIRTSDYKKLEEYLELINSYSEEQLKETYISVLSNEFLSQKGGAGLGFITTRIKSGNPLEHSFYALNEEKMLFTFSVSLDR
jgi:hypothetical protein